MGSHPPQRKLRRSFGSQPVGCFGGPRQPEAGVGVQVTQAQSSRWTFRSLDVGDLATWRIWSRMTTGVPARTPLQPQLWHILYIRDERREVRLVRNFRTRQALLCSNCRPRVSSSITAPHHLVDSKPLPFFTENSKKPKPDRQK